MHEDGRSIEIPVPDYLKASQKMLSTVWVSVAKSTH
jgi:hypothetical protein